MRMEKLLLLADSDFVDPAKPFTLANLKPDLYRAEQDAWLILHRDRVLKNGNGLGGVISQEVDTSNFLGLTIRPHGLVVSVTTNAVEVDVRHGADGCVMTVSAMGLHIGLPLTAEARDHLIAVLQKGLQGSR